MITMKCVECKATSLNGIFEHLVGCSGKLNKPMSGTDYIRPPATEIVFSTEAERKKFMKGLRGGSGAKLPAQSKNNN